MTLFSHLIVEQIPGLRRYARALTGGHVEDADDLVQDTLERAFAKWSLFRVGSKLRPWLFAIMHNVFINELRRPGNRLATGSMDEAEAIGTPAPQESHVEVREVLVALGRLAPELREVLVLVTVEEFSYAETARILGVPMGTVMSRLFRARGQLRLLTEGGAPAGVRSGLRLVLAGGER